MLPIISFTFKVEVPILKKTFAFYNGQTILKIQVLVCFILGWECQISTVVICFEFCAVVHRCILNRVNESDS